MSMSTFQWIIVIGLALALLHLHYAVKAILAVGQNLYEAAMGKEGYKEGFAGALWHIVDRLTEIAEQAERLADCYARATHDPVEEAKKKEQAEEIAHLRALDESVTRAVEERARQARVARAARKHQQDPGGPGDKEQTE
jgi:hypothetical protein